MHSFVKALNSSLSLLWLFVLNITETLACSVRKGFKLARNNISKWLANIKEIRLGHFFRNVPDNNISLGVKVGRLLLVQDYLFSIQISIVHFVETPVSFCFCVEVEVSKALGLPCLLVEHNLSIS